MKNITNALRLSLVGVVLFILSISCEDILDQQPVSSFNEEVIFSDINLANAFMSRIYTRIYWNITSRSKTVDAMTDQIMSRFHGFPEWCNGQLTPSALGYFGLNRLDWLEWKSQYDNINRLNILLANIDDVPTQNPWEEDQKNYIKGEAYFVRAYTYTNLMRTYGGIILMDKPFQLDQDFSTIIRSSLKETKDFILADIQKAIELLPLKDKIDQGRATQGAAAALKSRLLTFCASKLVNGGYEPGNPLVSLPEGSQEQHWRDARDAAKELIDGNHGFYNLTGTTVEPPENMTEEQIWEYADNYHSIFLQRGAWNDEVIWGLNYTKEPGGGLRSTVNQRQGPNGYNCHGWIGANEHGVREFEMADGSKFIWDKYDPGNETLREATASELEANPFLNPYYGREPRFYAIVLYHGAPWVERPPGIDAPPFIQTGSFVKAGGDHMNDDDITPGWDGGASPNQAWNASRSGYYLKKFLDPTSYGPEQDNENAWILLRYAEVLLNYAEACIELGELQNGLDALNKVRNRAGLPGRQTTSQAEAIEFVRHERNIELYGEELRWFDIRRWMICDEIISRNLHRMRVWEWEDGKMRWEWDKSYAEWPRRWVHHFYWIPISFEEINRAPQLQQNPGY